MDSSLSITFTGKSSTLESVFFPPVDLQGEYQIGLVDFQSYNSIYNVNAPDNKLYYYEPIELTDTPKGNLSIADLNKKLKGKLELEFGTTKTIINATVPKGIYLIRSMGLVRYLLQTEIRSDTEKIPMDQNIWYCKLDSPKTITIPEGNYEIEEIEKEVQKTIPDFKLVPNNVLMNCQLMSSKLFDFTKGGMGVDMLGFVEYTEPNIFVHARNKININNVNVIRIKCNIAAGSFINGKPDHTIHSFFPLIPPGYKLVEVVKNIIYYPINVRTLDVVTITIVDQNDRIVDFHGEEITLRCHIRKFSP